MLHRPPVLPVVNIIVGLAKILRLKQAFSNFYNKIIMKNVKQILKIYINLDLKLFNLHFNLS